VKVPLKRPVMGRERWDLRGGGLAAKLTYNKRAEGKTMTEHGDMVAHEQTYAKVIGLFKWGALSVAVVVAVVIWLIAR